MKIKNVEQIQNKYPLWKPQDVVFIKNMEWSIGKLVMTLVCQLRGEGIGWPDLNGDFFKITILFKNVSNLKLDFTSHELQQVSGFDIVDVSNNGWEKVNFQIEDYEDGAIAFNCEDVEICEVFTSTKGPMS